VLSILIALGIALVPTPTGLSTPQGSLVIGAVVTFLFLWGVAAPLFLKRRRRT
jgi:hypothetical protein